MSENPQKILFEKILNYSITLLSAREYSEKLLEEKIEKKFIEPKTYYRKHSNSYHTTKEKTESEISEIREISGQVLDFLIEKKYLDEHRTAENFLRYMREYSPRGKRMIAQDMYKKKIDPEISEQVLAEFSEEEEQKDCITLAKKKMGANKTKHHFDRLSDRYTKSERETHSLFSRKRISLFNDSECVG